MKRESILGIGSLLMILLALAIGYIGVFGGPNILLPPLITSVGFVVIAWVFFSFRKA